MKKLVITLIILAFVPAFVWAEDPAPATKVEAGKEVSTTVPKFPTVMIGGKNVMEVVQQSRMFGGVPVPEEISDDKSMKYLTKRVKISPFKHNPQQGKPTAPITIIEMFDLSCVQCMEPLEEVRKAFEEFNGSIRIVHVFNPTETSNPNRLVPFYGKIAQDNGKFWEYRNKSSKVKDPGLATYFNILVKLGMDPMLVRKSAMKDASKFYRELDADALLLKKMKVKYSPVWLVNGIKVSERTIPVDKMKWVLTYELEKINAEKRRARERGL